MTIAFRPAGGADEAFLLRVVTETITHDLRASEWPEALRNQLIPLQAATRFGAVLGNFPGGESRVIVVDGADSGWLYYAPLETEVRLVEIMILYARRGRGVGTAAVRHVIEVAGGKPVRLHVNVLNHGAVRLYEKLGFERVGGDAVNHFMEHRGTPC